MSDSQSQPQKPSFWVRFWRILIRLIFVLAIGILLGVAIYWAVPTVYRQFIQPVQIHEMRLDTVETRLDLYEDGTDGKLANLQGRLQTLESQQDNDKERIAALEGRLNELESLTATQQAQIDNWQALADQWAGLENTLADLDSKLGELQNAQSRSQVEQQKTTDELALLVAQLAEQKSELEDLSEVVYAEDERWETIQHEIQTIQAMELLTRARFQLSQGNLVLAQSDLQAARDLLAALQEQAPEALFELLGTTIGYLEAALEALPASPVTASDNLENAWQLILVNILSPDSVELAPVPPQTAPELTPTPSPTPSS